MKKANKNKIIEDAQKRDLRVRANFTLDEVVYTKFQKECEKNNVPMSRVLEAFMVDFVKGEAS